MDKFEIYVHGEKIKPPDNECFSIISDIDHADAYVVEGEDLASRHVFTSLDKAVQSLVCRYVDLVSCSEEKSEAIAARNKESLGQAKNSMGALRKREGKLLDYAKKYKIKLSPPGKVILAPSCSGKSFWLKSHEGWQDLDDIAFEFKLHGERYSRLPHTEEEERKHYARIDTWLNTMRRLGFHVLGSLYEAFKADAIVIIDEATHKKYTDEREDVSWESAQAQRQRLLDLAKEKNIPVYSTIDAAVDQFQTAD